MRRGSCTPLWGLRELLRFDSPMQYTGRRVAADLGSGPHVCIGAALTLIEAEVALRHILQRWPGLQLSEARPQWNHNPVYRGLSVLSVRSS